MPLVPYSKVAKLFQMSHSAISPSLIVLMIIDQYRNRIYQFKTGKRRGFQYYVQGQVKEISKNFALEIKKLEIVLKKQEVKAV